MEILNNRKKMNNRGVFGLTSIQLFFAVILGVALLAYVIVIILGTLQQASILPDPITTIVNESSWINGTGDTLNTATLAGFSSPTILLAINTSSNLTIAAGNYTLTSGGTLSNATAVQWNNVLVTYTYASYSTAENNVNSMINNVSNGTTSFFGAINPVYAILAVLVIILVLVVLVRVVTGNGSASSRGETPL